MAKLQIDSDIVGELWKQLTGAEIERTIFNEDTYKILLPLVLLYDVRKDLIQKLHG